MCDNSSLSLAALVSHPIQYQSPLFRAIDNTEHVDLTVYFCDDRGTKPTVDPGFGKEIVWDKPLLEGYEHEFLKNWRRKGGNDLPGDVNPGIVSKLHSTDHDVLWIHGYTSVTNWLALLTANVIDLPVVFRGESTLIDPPPSYVRVIKSGAIRGLTRLVDAYGVIGSHNRKFYRSYGVQEEQMFHAPYTVHNEYFQTARQDLQSKEKLRAEEGIPDRPTVLFVGKLIKRKRPGALLRAFAEATAPGEAVLLFIGDGERRDSLEQQANGLGRASDIVFAGFKNQSELPKFYKLSDVFVLPSVEENWGLVINEAMNFELPIVTTEAVGAAADLVDDSNGQVIPPDDTDALRAAINDVLNGDRGRMGEHSLAKIKKWGIRETASGIVRAAKYADSHHSQ